MSDKGPYQAEPVRVSSPKRDDETQTGYALRLVVQEKARYDALTEIVQRLREHPERRDLTWLYAATWIERIAEEGS